MYAGGNEDRLRDTCARAVRNVKNLWYEEREQLDSGGGGALSQGAGHDGSFYYGGLLGPFQSSHFLLRKLLTSKVAHFESCSLRNFTFPLRESPIDISMRPHAPV